MPSILCIESSQTYCSVSVGIDSEIAASLKSSEAQSHAESISTLIIDVLNQAKIRFSDLDAIAVSDGPGSYTGLRIGASTAKGLCFALNLPLIAVSTLKALAHGYMLADPSYTGLIWPMIDARRMEVYHAVFDSNLHELSKVSNSILDKDFQVAYPSDTLVLCGDGAKKAADFLQIQNAGIEAHASHLVALAEEAYIEKRFVQLDTYQPFYLKPANITAPKAK